MYFEFAICFAQDELAVNAISNCLDSVLDDILHHFDDEELVPENFLFFASVSDGHSHAPAKLVFLEFLLVVFEATGELGVFDQKLYYLLVNLKTVQLVLDVVSLVLR